MNARRIIQFVMAAMMLVAGLWGAAGVARAEALPTGVVNVDALNLRAGPGTSYLVLRVLPEGHSLTLMGRSTDGLWLEVRQLSGPGGWVYASYVSTQTPIASLPITQAAGGPSYQPPAGSQYSLYATIVNNRAVVTVQDFPANAAIVVKLARTGSAAGLEVVRGATDASGAAQLTFVMPSHWADGQPVNEPRMALTAGTLDGRFSETIFISYFRY
jgi:hypothetical protein